MGISNNRRYFEEVVLKSSKPVMVDFGSMVWALQNAVGPIIEELEYRIRRKSSNRKVDVDANQEFAAK
jgi:thioredoxin 1